MRGYAFVVVTACASPAKPTPKPVVSAPVEKQPPPPVTRAEEPAPAPVRWANIVTVENCFYFSGPFEGRDETLRGSAELEHAGARVKLRLGNAVFEGTLDDESLEVRRTTTREFEGTWAVTETISGTVHGGEVRGTYRYEECGQDQCPGRCTQTAELSGPVQIVP